MTRPQCKFCELPATHLAAQSRDQGKTVEWVTICRFHCEGWNDGGDWKAPAYRIGDAVFYP